jgi:signal transduction histidine kinase
MNANFTVLGEERRFTGEIELSLFRIVQETLNNIRKHARASAASVKAEFTKNGIILTVSDNGQGFSLDGTTDDLPHNGKLGLMGMQERAWLLGGTMEIVSKPNEGTTLLFKIPVKK